MVIMCYWHCDHAISDCLIWSREYMVMVRTNKLHLPAQVSSDLQILIQGHTAKPSVHYEQYHSLIEQLAHMRSDS